MATGFKFCGCKDCKKMKRKGFILGTRRDKRWPNTEFSMVSDYVPFHRFAKGKDPSKFAPAIEME